MAEAKTTTKRKTTAKTKAAAQSKDDILEAIKGLSVLELADLVKDLRRRSG